MITAKLPGIFRHDEVGDLIRLGRDYDGGYVICGKDVQEADFLIGLGINDDWSFETDFAQKNDVPVLAYDGSINGRQFLWRAIKELRRVVDKPSLTKRAWKTYFSYTNFFKGHRRHIEKFVGREKGEHQVSLKEIFDSTASQKIFLKIDIEGSEYEILDEILNVQNRITGMAIEFHDCGQHLEEIGSFLERLNLQIVHIHANNYSPLDASLLPAALEISFSADPGPSKGACRYPRALDRPNKASGDEICLSFEGG